MGFLDDKAVLFPDREKNTRSPYLYPLQVYACKVATVRIGHRSKSGKNKSKLYIAALLI